MGSFDTRGMTWLIFAIIVVIVGFVIKADLSVPLWGCLILANMNFGFSDLQQKK